jgi:transposase
LKGALFRKDTFILADTITISLRLPGCKITRLTSELDQYVIWVESTAQGAMYTHCGRASTDYHDGYKRTILYGVTQANLKELTALASTIHRWREWTGNFFHERVINEGMEGINNKIKLLKPIAYELPNFTDIRVCILMEFAVWLFSLSNAAP